MNVGLIIPICAMHEMQALSLKLARKFSQESTSVIALFNGLCPFVVPSGVEVVEVAERFTDEADLWQWGLDRAVRDGWDWCFYHHDDFCLLGAGWEQDLENAHDWRVALATWWGYANWENGSTSVRPCGHLSVTFDSCGFGFRTDIFQERGYVTNARYGYGYGAWDACAWALSQQYATWQILTESDHQWSPRNTRSIVGEGAPGNNDVSSRWFSQVLPARVVDNKRIQIQDRIVQIAPETSTVADEARAWLSRDEKTTIRNKLEEVT